MSNVKKGSDRKQRQALKLLQKVKPLEQWKADRNPSKEETHEYQRIVRRLKKLAGIEE